VSPENVARIAAAVQQNPALAVTVDLVALQVRFGNDAIPCTMPEGAHKSLTSGQWDFLAQLIEGEDEIRETASRLPYMTNFA
jgi:3-isopropylmalate/(R)-2-methylmalate dehydratase small subunit